NRRGRWVSASILCYAVARRRRSKDQRRAIMSNASEMPGQTPSQTIGPFFSFGMDPRNVLVEEQTTGERILIEGCVLDGEGQPVLDALVEIWQADGGGVYAHPADPQHEQADPHFTGFGRSETTDEGRFWFKTVR